VADITMCAGKGCHIKQTCYRYTATPNQWCQAYWAVEPYRDGKCDMQMKVEVIDEADYPPPDSGFAKL